MKLRKILLLLIICSNLSAQKINNINYSGLITLSNKTFLPFEIELKEQLGVVNGFSLTGKGTKNETKSDISGTYNKNEKLYILKETQVLETNSEEELSSFCYIHMRIKETGKLSSKRLEGEFIGYFSNGEQCATGKIILIEKEKLDKKVNQITKKIEKKIKKENKKKESDPIMETKILKDDSDMQIQWSSEKLIIYIWDANTEDGDRVNLTINGKTKLKNFETKRKRKKIKYRLSPGTNLIEIKAMNLGSNPPNTSRIELVDGKTKYPILTQLEINRSATIKIIK